MLNLDPSLLAAAVLALAPTTVPASAKVPSISIAPGGLESADAALARTIIDLFDADQELLADLAKAKEDQGFKRTYLAFVERVTTSPDHRNFYDPALYALWSREPDAPVIVRHAVEFRKATDARLRDIVARYGWPQRQTVGAQAAASFFFLFGHADDDNAWRLTQRATLERVAREDHVTPRLYAHLQDRLADVAGEPQIYGSIMGPDKVPGSAKLYAPLIDDVKAADARRAMIGLPSIETDLDKFRGGANIGPFMTPMTKGMKWTIDDVYATSGPASAGASPRP